MRANSPRKFSPKKIYGNSLLIYHTTSLLFCHFFHQRCGCIYYVSFRGRYGLSPSFVTVHNTVKGREKLREGRTIIRKLSIPLRRLSLFKAYQDLSCHGDFHRLQRHKAYRFCIKAPLQTVVPRGFAATFLKFSVKQFREPRKKRQSSKPANPCGSSHCGLL